MPFSGTLPQVILSKAGLRQVHGHRYELIPAMKHYAIIVTALQNVLVQGGGEFEPVFLTTIVKNVSLFLNQQHLPAGIYDHFSKPWLQANPWKSSAARIGLVVPELTRLATSYEYWGSEDGGDGGNVRGGSYLGCLLEANTLLEHNAYLHNPATDYVLMPKIRTALECFGRKHLGRQEPPIMLSPR